ncbi:aldose 1-epimerase family protein [Kallipyga massiliensis]|uniref:aldose 1-epimerase family protein n=1 Tax=Kallipyga massiliensis TaxID=1472764 RepID=UPI0026EAEA76|nr:aldose 1-epimerase family protein [Kallipyga massiliensis]
MVYHISNHILSVSVSDRGAELMSIKDAQGKEFLWQGDPKFWSGRAPNLFPYIARLTKGTYTYQGKDYQMPIHGFAPTAIFQVSHQSEETITLTLEDDDSLYEMYPYHFAFSISYRLEENSLHVQYIVENKDPKTMYFGVGGHPGINLPLEEGLAFEDYQLDFSSDQMKRVGFSKDCFVTGQDFPFPLENSSLPLRHDLFDEDAIVLKDTPDSVTLRSEKGTYSVTLVAPDFPYWGFWHRPFTEAPYLCMEPWSALPSRQDVVEDLEKQDNLTSLPPGQVHQRTWSLRFDS